MKTAILLLFVGCAATGTPDDDAAVDAPVAALGKADAATFTGLYASHATHHYNDDVPDLELRADGTFIRQRCYHASCAIETPETDHYDVYTSTAGKTYVRFHGRQLGDEIVADVYEIRAFSKGVQLRRAYSTRWQSLYATTPDPDPTCASGQEYVAGAGGCIAIPGASEDNCDASHGSWTDDDATAIGSYCICDVGSYLDASGSCAAL
jgi:hypothetical protein